MKQLNLIFICIIITTSTPTEKILDEEITTEQDLIEINEQTTLNSTFRQDEDDDDESSEEEKYEEIHFQNFQLPPYRPPIHFTTSLPNITTTVKLVTIATTTIGSAAADQIRYSVSRIPTSATAAIPAVTLKYKIINKVSPDTAAGSQIITITTTERPILSFAEEWNLTDVFHIGPQGRADCTCGKVPFKVDDPDRVGINEYPWTVAVIRTGIFGASRVHCGGSLINSQYILTTSYCVDGLYPDGLQVWITAYNTFQTDNYVEERILKRDIIEIFMHPNFNGKSNDNDIALLKLSKPIDISISSYYVPICLPAGENNYIGLNGRISGWGVSSSSTSSGRIFNSRLCKEDVPIISNEVCNRDTRHSGKITNNMMCAGLITPVVAPGQQHTCLGDPGGPLMVPNGGRYTLIGIMSWGYQKRQSYSPIVYTKVSGYSDWILHNTRDADWCGT